MVTSVLAASNNDNNRTKQHSAADRRTSTQSSAPWCDSYSWMMREDADGNATVVKAAAFQSIFRRYYSSGTVVDPIVLGTDLSGTPTKKVNGFKSNKAVMSDITVVNCQHPYPWRHSWST